MCQTSNIYMKERSILQDQGIAPNLMVVGL
jgi:hypothetical protein